MKKLTVLLMATAAFAAAQDRNIPLSAPSQPAVLKANLINAGSLTIAGGGTAGQVTVSSGGWKSSRVPKDMPQGMHRIDAGDNGLEITEDHNVVTLVSPMGVGSLTIHVPTNTSLQIRVVNGGKLTVSDVNGDLEVSNTNGSVMLTNVSGSVVASSQNGSITATLDKIAPGKPLSFTTVNGKVDVALPADTKAKLHLRAVNGGVYSDFDVKTDGDAAKPIAGGMHTDHAISGTINGGGPEFRFETMNGNVRIRKK